jgi:trans-aconitate methyltransferase
VGTEIDHVWRMLSTPRSPGQDGYFEHLRAELLDLFTVAPRRFVEIGCGTGLTGAELKRRYPGTIVDGFEYSEAAGKIAAERLDHVHIGDAERIDLRALYAPESIDALLLADVLEHLYDPWNFLVRIRPLLALDAQIVVSIPNVRNLALLEEIASGNFSYVPAGLLDVTHIRFFTNAEVHKMFADTGYEVTWMTGVRDGRIPNIAPAAFPANIETQHLVFKNVDANTLGELLSIQFYLRVRRRP